MCHSIGMKVITNERLKENYIQKCGITDWLPASLYSELKLYRYKKGEFICQEGRIIEQLFVQVHGKSKVTRSMNNGKEMLTSFNSGFSMLGHLEFFTHNPAFINVEVIEDTFCLGLYLSESTRAVLLQDVRFLQYMAIDLSKMIIKENQNSAINLVYPVRQRVASYILCTQNKGYFKDNYTHLAEYLGCSHRQLLRVLNSFVQEGMIAVHEKGYHILQENKLRMIAAELYSK